MGATPPARASSSKPLSHPGVDTLLARGPRWRTVLSPTRHPGVFTDGRDLYTESRVPGVSVYGERTLRQEEREFRYWSPRRSKLAALLHRAPDASPFRPTSRVLYLGAGTGTTASHLSDVLEEGVIFAVEAARRAFEKLLLLAERRDNLIPILADARQPRAYRAMVEGAGLLYQDVAQRDQARIFLRNLPMAREGRGVLMVKARSVDTTAPPEEVYRRELQVLRKGGVSHARLLPLEPYQHDHAAVVVEP